MKVISLVLGTLQTNGYIVFDEQTKEAIVIDPAAEAAVIKKHLEKYELTLKQLVLTHGHSDHIGAINELREWYPSIRVVMHEADASFLSNPGLNLSKFMEKPVVCDDADAFISEGDVIELGDFSLMVLHTPGHTPGGISLYDEAHGLLFTGDALFAGSIGRTDFPGGSMETLVDGIRSKLMFLPDETIVLSGHGPSTSIGTERRINPFVGDMVW